MRNLPWFRFLAVVPILVLASCPATMPPPDGGMTEGVTFGATEPDRSVVEARPQTINPYAANADAELPRSADLTRDLPPIGDQGGLGSCTAWASGYAAATYTANRQFGWGASTSSHQASPGYLYERLIETDNLDCGSGTFIQTAMNLLIQDGCSSFDTVDYSDQVCSANSSTSDAANFRIGSFNRVVETDRHAVRAELAAGRILVIGASLYDDFPQWTGDGVYRGSGNFLTQGSQHAAHAMAVVGYDDNRQAYRIMNSWSTAWGDFGFMWMHYDTFHATVFEVYSIEPAGDRQPPSPPGPGPEPEPLPDPDAFLDEAYQFADVDPVSREDQVYLVFYYHFTAPVFIRTITVTDPSLNQGQQTYNAWYQEGYVYFVQTGGFQWEPGPYTIEFNTRTENGNDIIYSGVADIAALDDGSSDNGLCSDLCIFAFDGECDDGGPGADYNVCAFGTDCFDCGVRGDDSGVDMLCNDTCRYAGDGECDDGGPGADYAVCEYGTDCTDCGSRDDVVVDQLCEDSCIFAFDGECDDGGAGADFDVCAFGTDCFDCGPRDPNDQTDAFCTDTCPFAFDGECDDGGLGALTDVCAFGSDCFDCGPRSADGFKSVVKPESAAASTGTGESSKPTARKFRGIPIKTPAWAKELPTAGVRAETLGANRQPVTIVQPEPADEGEK
ncbi:MAG: C1 family peptidase [Phycisphaerae bacterium]|nr:C1 family peptidase [Phycisphaerae bacterium]